MRARGHVRAWCEAWRGVVLALVLVVAMGAPCAHAAARLKYTCPESMQDYFALKAMGHSRMKRGETEVAMACFEEALVECEFLNMDGATCAPTYYNLGALYMSEFGDKDSQKRAEQLLLRALSGWPEDKRRELAMTHLYIGQVLDALGHIDAALVHFEEAVEMDPDLKDASYQLGHALRKAGKLDEVHGLYADALSTDAGSAMAYFTLASLQEERGDVLKASRNLRRSMVMFKKLPKKVQPRAVRTFVSFVDALADFREREASLPVLTNLIDSQLRKGELPALAPQQALNMPIKPEKQLDIAALYAEMAVAHMREWSGVASVRVAGGRGEALQQRRVRAPRSAEELRLAYVSNFLGDYPQGRHMHGIFGEHEERVTVFSGSSGSDSTRNMYLQAVEEESAGSVVVRDVSSMRSEQVAHAIKMHGVHVLVDLDGFFARERMEVLAARPAPIQVSLFGYPGSTGGYFVDYLTTDAISVPPEYAALYSEHLLILPGPHVPASFDVSHRDMMRPPFVLVDGGEDDDGGGAGRRGGGMLFTRAAVGLPEDAFVLANFDPLVRIDRRIFAAWMEILLAEPRTVLWLLHDDPTATPGEDGLTVGERSFVHEAEAMGVDASRLVFSVRVAHDHHVRRAALADLYLSTPRYSSHASVADVLWGGVPVVSLPGVTLASRSATSLALAAGGSAALVAPDIRSYVTVVVDAVRQPERVAAMRAALEEMRDAGAMFNRERWVTHFERAHAIMWELWSMREDDTPHVDAWGATELALSRNATATNHNNTKGGKGGKGRGRKGKRANGKSNKNKNNGNKNGGDGSAAPRLALRKRLRERRKSGRSPVFAHIIVAEAEEAEEAAEEAWE